MSPSPCACIPCLLDCLAVRPRFYETPVCQRPSPQYVPWHNWPQVCLIALWKAGCDAMDSCLTPGCELDQHIATMRWLGCLQLQGQTWPQQLDAVYTSLQ